jgi:hypothetical protein
MNLRVRRVKLIFKTRPTTYSIEMGSSKPSSFSEKDHPEIGFSYFWPRSGTLPSNNDEQSVVLERGLLINCPPHPKPRS